MRKTKEETEVSIEKILNAAEKVFLQRGYSAARIEEIAKKAGMSKGGIFWHFENKAALFKAICQRAINRLKEFFSEENSSDILENYRKITIRIQKDSAFEVLLLLSIVQQNKEISEKYLKDLYKEIATIFEDALKKFEIAKQRGELKEEINPKDVLFQIVLTLCGFSRIKELQAILGPVVNFLDPEAVINNLFKGLKLSKT